MKSDSPTHNLNSNTDFNEVNFYSPKYQNSLTKSQNLNNYLKNDSIYENLGNNLVLPSINQKKNLSNSGRNIVLTKTKFLEKEDEMKNSIFINELVMQYFGTHQINTGAIKNFRKKTIKFFKP